MAAIDFPNSPTNGQKFTSGGLTWTYQTGVGWLLDAASGVSGGFTFMQDAVPTATAVGQTWFQTSTGDCFVWHNDGTSTQWIEFVSGGSGYTYVTDVAPTPQQIGDTWFDMSTGVSGGSSWVAIDKGLGSLVWVQSSLGAIQQNFSPILAQALFATSQVISAAETVMTFQVNPLVRPVNAITVSTAGSMTALTAGVYRVTCMYTMNLGGAPTAGNWVYGWLRHYNTAGTQQSSLEILHGGGTSYGFMVGNRLFDMAAGDYVQTRTANSTPSNSTLREGVMTMERVY